MIQMLAIAKVAVIAATSLSGHAHVVVPGDTLSAIGQETGTSWQAVYDANRSVVGSDPNLIYPGQVLAVPGPGAYQAAVPVAPRPAMGDGPARTWGVTYGFPNRCGDGDGDGWDVPCGSAAAPAPVTYHAPVQAAPAAPGGAVSVFTGGGGFQSCVIARESGGNSQVMNATGHYGLYQFSASTWAAYGGSPALFGHASVSEQNQVFSNAIAAGGQSNWAPYDGC